MSNDNLVTLLKMLHAGPTERKFLAEKLPEKMRAYQDGNIYEIANVREFVLTEDMEGAGLVQLEIYNTVMKGAVKAKCMENVIPIVNMPTDQMRVPYGDAESIAPLVAEGAEFPAMYQNYGYTSLTAEKYGFHVPISKELVKDSKFDIIGIELEKAGRNLSSQLNQMVLTNLLDGAGNEHDTGGAAQGIDALIAAKTLIKADGFTPDKIVVCPEAFGMIFKDYKPAYNEKAQDMLTTGIMPQICGVIPYECAVADASATYTWEYNSDGDIGMVMVDSANCGFIGIREPIQVVMHEQPLKMLDSPVIYARWDHVVTNANAISRVEY